MTKREQKWFDLGKESAKQFDCEKDALEAMDMETLGAMVNGYWSDSAWFHAGFIGREPEFVSAVRYGKIPECGQSINWVTKDSEAGVSCVKIIRKDADKNITDIRYADCGERTIISGWYLGGCGSDGEPLLVDC